MVRENLGAIQMFLRAWVGAGSPSASWGVTWCLQSLWLLYFFPDQLGIPTAGNNLWVWKG